MTTRSFGWGLGLLLAGIGCSILFIDLPLAQTIGSGPSLFKRFFTSLTYAGEYATGYHLTPYMPAIVLCLLAAARALWARHWHAALPLLYVALLFLLSRYATDVAKQFFQRMRPLPVLANPDAFPGFFTTGSSFPSGHVSYFMSLGLGLMLILPKRWWVSLLVLALPVSISLGRVAQNLHFVSDVLASVAIVWMLAYGLQQLQQRLLR